MKISLLFLMLFGTFCSVAQTNTNLGTSSGTGGTYNAFLGYYAGNVSTGTNNAFVGAQAGQLNTTGASNVFFGYASGYSNTTGSNNSFLGRATGFANTTGVGNTFSGYYSGRFNSTANYNTGNGYQALLNTSSGSNNTAGGTQALYNNTIGNYNTASGMYSLFNATTASSNTAVGYQALYTNTTGSNNTALGYGADVNNAAWTNATSIGYGAIATASNFIQLGNSAVTKVQVGTGNTATLVAGGLQITGGAGAGKVLTSDASGVATWQPGGSGTSPWLTTGTGGADIYNSNTGNVGLGTSSAPEKLTVQGNIQFPLSNALGYLVSSDKLTHNGNTVGNYSLGWFWDSWQTGAPTGYLSSAGGLKFFTGSLPRVAIDFAGSMGIGTMTPQAKLDVSGGEIQWGTSGSRLNMDQGGSIELRGASTSPYIDFSNSASQDYSMRMILSGNNMLNIDGGNVGIGTSSPDTKLAVNGTIHTKEVKIDLIGWPDYVFEDAYQLRSLQEVKTYIDKNKHLPEVPSAQEIEANGAMVGELNKILMKKVEELTLYLIQSKEQIDRLEKEVIELKKKLN